MYSYKAKVLEVVDGDTLDILIDCGFDIHTSQRVRLHGIDTPETRTRNKKEKALGLKTKQYVKDKIEGKTIFVDSEEKDKFGRYLVTVLYKDNIDDEQAYAFCLNQELIDQGLAKAYFGGKKIKWS